MSHLYVTVCLPALSARNNKEKGVKRLLSIPGLEKGSLEPFVFLIAGGSGPICDWFCKRNFSPFELIKLDELL